MISYEEEQKHLRRELEEVLIENGDCDIPKF